MTEADFEAAVTASGSDGTVRHFTPATDAETTVQCRYGARAELEAK